MRPLAAIIQNHLRLVWRDPQSIVLILLVPFFLISLLSIAFEELIVGKPQVEVRVIDRDQTEASRLVVQGLAASEVLDIAERSSSADPKDQLDPRHFAALVIPAGFAETLASEGRARLELYGDPGRQAYVEILQEQLESTLALGQLPAVVGNAAPEGAQAAASEAAAGVIETAVRDAALETLPASERGGFPSAYEQTVPGFAVLFGFFGVFFVAANIARERDLFHTWPRTLLARAPRLGLLAAIVTSYALLGTAQLAVLLVLGRLVWGMELGSDPVALVLIIVLWSVVAAAMALMISSLLARSLRAASQILNLCAVILGVLGGALIPVAFLPAWMAVAAPFAPQYWAVDAMHDLLARGKGFSDILPHLTVLAAFAAVFLAISFQSRALVRV